MNKLIFEFKSKKEMYNFVLSQIFLEKLQFQKEINDELILNKKLEKKILYKRRIKKLFNTFENNNCTNK